MILENGLDPGCGHLTKGTWLGGATALPSGPRDAVGGSSQCLQKKDTPGN